MFWSWFPLGPTGLRTCLLFMTVLGVFILRIANLRLASRQASSAAYEALEYFLSKAPYKTLAWYTFSAFIFSETYIHSTSDSKELGIVDSSKPYERAHLNERPIMLRTLFLLLGAYQTGYHLLCDWDQVKVPQSQLDESQTKQPQDPVSIIRAEVNHILQHATRSMIITPLPAFIVYSVSRRRIWGWTFSFAKSIFSNLPKYQKPSTFPPFFGDLLFVYVGWGWVLVTIWGFANAAFNAYLAQTPVDKKGRPLSTSSKDPNGTLLNGLKSRKELVASSAFAELALISKDVAERRQTLFKELERKDGSTWAQLVTVCLGQLQGVSARITSFTTPPTPAPTPITLDIEPTDGDINHLPRIAPPVKNDNVYAAAPPPRHPHAAALESFAKSSGMHPGAQDPLSPRARRLVTSAINSLLSPERQQQLTHSGLAKTVQRYFIDFVKLPYIGAPFRQTFARRVSAVIIGEPGKGGSSLPLLIYAIQSLSRLAVRASTEDSWGKASKDVATIIRTYSATIMTIEAFVDKTQPHWTDVEFRGKRVPQVEMLLTVLRTSLRSILEAYDGYSELGLTFKDKRIAREKSGLGRAEADPFIDTVGNAGGRAEMRERRRARVGT